MAHQLTLNTTALAELKAAAEALPVEKKVQDSKTVTPSTSAQTVSPDSGYDGLASVTVEAMPTGSVGTPSISVDSSTGVVTATTAVDAGYVDGTDKTGTMSLTTKAAATITPGTSNKTIAAGTYLTGTQTIAGDADLLPKNILKGVEIFGVTGTVVKQPALPAFTYTGTYDTETDDDDNWKIKFLTSGKLTLSEDRIVDLFAVGGGGNGGTHNGDVGTSNTKGGGGGGGGYTATIKNKTLASGSYTITVGGAGGTSKVVSGSTTLVTAAGGSNGGDASYSVVGSGGNGGSGGGPGCNTGTDSSGNVVSNRKGYAGEGGNAGTAFTGATAGTGQGTTTREFGESSGTLYAGGGGGGCGYYSGDYSAGGGGGGGDGARPGYAAKTGTTNTGGGGGGGGWYASSTRCAGAAGGSGIVVMRNAGGAI